MLLLHSLLVWFQYYPGKFKTKAKVAVNSLRNFSDVTVSQDTCEIRTGNVLKKTIVHNHQVEKFKNV
jgi:hypothetical protein